MLEFSVYPSYDDYLAANWLLYRRRWISWKMLRGFALSYLFVLFISYLPSMYGASNYEFSWGDLSLHMKDVAKLTIVCFAGIALLSAVYLRPSAQKMFDRLGLIDQKTSYTISDDSFFVSCDIGTSNLKWHHLDDFLISKEVIVIRRAFYFIYLIPLRQLDTETIERLLAYLRAGGVKES